MIKITLPVTEYHNFSADILQAVGRGHIYKIADENIVQETDDLFMTLEAVQAVIEAGGEVENFWVGIEKPKNDFTGLNTSTPELTINGTYMAEILETPASEWADFSGLLSKEQYLALRVPSDG